METGISKMPSREIIEWYFSLKGKDLKGVAVRYNGSVGKLVPDKNFRKRVKEWSRTGPDFDPYSLMEMPDLVMLNDYVRCRGVVFNLETRRLERRLRQPTNSQFA